MGIASDAEAPDPAALGPDDDALIAPDEREAPEDARTLRPVRPARRRRSSTRAALSGRRPMPRAMPKAMRRAMPMAIARA
ncbi:hypothetical protein ACFSHQ_13245 [Gemmobacter lanyuensis]